MACKGATQQYPYGTPTESGQGKQLSLLFREAHFGYPISFICVCYALHLCVCPFVYLLFLCFFVFCFRLNFLSSHFLLSLFLTFFFLYFLSLFHSLHLLLILLSSFLSLFPPKMKYLLIFFFSSLSFCFLVLFRFVISIAMLIFYLYFFRLVYLSIFLSYFHLPTYIPTPSSWCLSASYWLEYV